MNRLADETSPYLRQHARNPVEWYPWGPEAFAAARERDVPILLSVGYSACHWCHVMAHESFEDADTARVMNAGFVNVKVDREERPDVDSIYMEAVQAVSGSGGWPMTVFLLPDGRPFLGGTYFPRERFVALLRQVSAAWESRRSAVEESATSLTEAVRAGVSLPSLDVQTPEGAEEIDAPVVLSAATDALIAGLDPEWGGFGRAPKFPQPTVLDMLLLSAVRAGRVDALHAVTTTLDAMAAGGIYDHLGGGFARYSTDRWWLVPHFEKMLYDNALLARLYTRAWQVTADDRYRQVVRETVDYLRRAPVRIAGAGLASAEDADSEGEEGRFYVWDLDEVLAVGGAPAAAWYGVTAEGNWEGRNILHRPDRAELERPPEIEEARRRLFERRETRVRPGLDEKVLTEWNAMAVAALAEAGAAFGEVAWVSEAEDIAAFLLSSLRRPHDGRWLRSWQAGTARHLAYASDHAWLVEAFTRLAEATGTARWVTEARVAADALIDLFLDEAAGGFRTSGRDADALIARPMDTQDGALPSANSVAATALLRLGVLTGDVRYSHVSGAVIDALRGAATRVPAAFSGMVAAAELQREGLLEVVIAGRRPDLVDAVRRVYLPGAVVAWGEPFASPLWEGRDGADAAGLAYVCREYACLAPVGDAETLLAQLSG